MTEMRFGVIGKSRTQSSATQQYETRDERVERESERGQIMSNSADHQTHPSGSEEWLEWLRDVLHLLRLEIVGHEKSFGCGGLNHTEGDCPWCEGAKKAIADAHVLSAPAVQTERVPDAWTMRCAVTREPIGVRLRIPMAPIQCACHQQPVAYTELWGSPVQDGAHAVEDAHG